jgi:hypothetical protein
MSQRSSDPELKDIESALGVLVPVASRLNRDELMFQAGVASAVVSARRPWVWPSIAAALAVALVSESLVLAVRPGERVIERIVVVHAPVPAAPRSPMEVAPSPVPVDFPGYVPASGEESSRSSWVLNSDYHRLQELVLRFGLDALPERPSSLLSRSDGQVDPMKPPAPSAGLLRRFELEKLLRRDPGGPS